MQSFSNTEHKSARRHSMAGEHEAIVVYGTTWCPDCKQSKQFLGDQRVHYHWVNIEQDLQAMEYVVQVNDGKRIIPTIVFPDGDILVEPSNAELAAKLGLTTEAERTYYDVIIVGAGPAGLTAAIYTAREGLDTLVIEKAAPGGQAGITQVIDNFPGFDEGISGEEFARRLTNQARRFGVEILQAKEVTGLRLNGRYREVLTVDGSCYGARAVLLATGARYRRLNTPGEADLIGINIHFCATCDGAFYRDKDVLVIGGGNSAFEEGLFLTKFASKVTIVSRSTPKASSILQEKVAGREDMKVVSQRVVEAFIVDEDGKLGAVTFRDRETDALEEWHPDGVFVFIGMEPNSEFLPPEFEQDRYGFLLTSETMQTSVKGVFAAGDVRAGATAQAASAAGEGAAVALQIRQYLQGMA
jgi:thioredoxin reductase (NADPH)